MTAARAGRALVTSGVVFMHCCPSAIAPHVEWAIAEVLGRPVRLEWTAQPAAPGTCGQRPPGRVQAGTGARLAGALRAWPMLVYEVTEQGTALTDGERLAYLPGRGFHRRTTSANGDVVVAEERLRGVLSRARSAEDYAHALQDLLGTAWDAEARALPAGWRRSSGHTAAPGRLATTAERARCGGLLQRDVAVRTAPGGAAG